MYQFLALSVFVMYVNLEINIIISIILSSHATVGLTLM